MLKLGGRYVGKGKYWSAVDGSITDMSGGGVLPGDERVLYIRRPKGGAFAAIPAVAVLYALTFPGLGPAAVFVSWAIAIAGVGIVAIWGLVRGAVYARELAAMGWRPVTAYFAGLGKHGKKK